MIDHLGHPNAWEPSEKVAIVPEWSTVLKGAIRTGSCHTDETCAFLDGEDL